MVVTLHARGTLVNTSVEDQRRVSATHVLTDRGAHINMSVDGPRQAGGVRVTRRDSAHSLNDEEE